PKPSAPKPSAPKPSAPQKQLKFKENTKTLELDIRKAPPSDNFKFSTDFGEYSHPFWVKYFYTPDDFITTIYKDAVNKLADILPANFQLYDDEPSAFGIANLELRDEFKRPIKKNVLLSKLKNGDYEIQSSKSDKNIAASITFFRNNLPSFIFYKEQDD
ncbi:MAG: hypothetical protein ACK56F_33025, partial [bacterium]